jgi:hypothetical protein
MMVVNAKHLAKILAQMRENRTAVSFSDQQALCGEFFGKPRQVGSQLVYRTPWPGDPRVNIQPGKDGRAKPYQVKQVLAAVDKMQGLRGESL